MSRYNIAQTINLFKALIKKQVKISLLFFSLMMMFGPIRFYFSMFYNLSLNFYFDKQGSLIANLLIFLLLGIFFAVVLAFSYFQYLNNSSESEFIASLPVPKSYYYLVSFMSGYLNVVIIYLPAFIINSLLLFIYSGFFSVLPAIFSLISILIFYVIVVFALVNSGNILDTFTQIVLINLLPLIGFFAVTQLFSNTIVGWSVINFYKLLWLIVPIFPVGYTLLYLGALPNPMTELSKTVFPYSLSYYYSFWLLLVIGFFLISLYIHRKRKIEFANTSGTHSFLSSIYLILFTISSQILLTLLISPFIILRIDIILLMLILLAIAMMFYLLVKAMIDRSFINFARNILTYFVIGALTLALMQAFSNTQGFTLFEKDLEVSEINSVKLDYRTNWYGLSPFAIYSNILSSPNNGYYYSLGSELELIISDPDEIAVLLELSIKWEDYYQEYYNSIQYYRYTLKESSINTFDDYTYGRNASEINITFNLNNQKSHTKSFFIPTNWTKDLLPFFLDNEKYITKFSNYESKDPLILMIAKGDTIYSEKTLSKAEERELFRKISNDFENLDLKSIDYNYVATLSFNNGLYVVVTEEMPETIAYLNELNLEMPGPLLTLSFGKEYYLLLPNSNLFIFYNLNIDFSILSLYYSDAIHHDEILSYLTLTNEEVNAISEYLLPVGNSKEPFGLIIGFESESTYLIPPQHLDQIRQLFKDKPIKEKTFEDFFEDDFTPK